MKPTPRYDFPVGVWRASADHSGPAAAAYEGIYSVTLNRTVTIEFVPTVDRRLPWPPELPPDVDQVDASAEARRTTVALARFLVTPDPERRGTIETISAEDDVHVVFYVSAAEFEEFARELASIAERMTGVRDAVLVSSLGGSALSLFLLERFLPDGRLSERELSMLGR
jgi:hypothetical protein